MNWCPVLNSDSALAFIICPEACFVLHALCQKHINLSCLFMQRWLNKQQIKGCVNLYLWGVSSHPECLTLKNANCLKKYSGQKALNFMGRDWPSTDCFVLLVFVLGTGLLKTVDIRLTLKMLWLEIRIHVHLKVIQGVDGVCLKYPNRECKPHSIEWNFPDINPQISSKGKSCHTWRRWRFCCSTSFNVLSFDNTAIRNIYLRVSLEIKHESDVVRML